MIARLRQAEAFETYSEGAYAEFTPSRVHHLEEFASCHTFQASAFLLDRTVCMRA